MPAGSVSTRASGGPPESSFKDISLETKAGSAQWNMVGNPFAVSVSSVYIYYSSQDSVECPGINPGCSLDIAEKNGIVSKKLYHYNETSQQYDVFDGDAHGLNPWYGFWIATLEKADGEEPLLLITRPKGAN